MATVIDDPFRRRMEEKREQMAKAAQEVEVQRKRAYIGFTFTVGTVALVAALFGWRGALGYFGAIMVIAAIASAVALSGKKNDGDA